ncbi:MAG: hypothetical protein Q4D13_06030 [Erysipelotrichaceae bacterium]|nr:hypothetical protein [Erysipelotrichaceae bacterium]
MKKFILLCMTIMMIISGGNMTIFAEEAETNTVIEVFVSEDGSEIRNEKHLDDNGNVAYSLVYVNNGDLYTCYNSSTGEMIDVSTGELLATICEETYVDNANGIMLMSSSYGGVTIADRWTYSYSSRTKSTLYNATENMVKNAIYSFLTAKNAGALAASIISGIAKKIINTAIKNYGNTNAVVHYIQTRKYANRYVLSDFANIYEELDEDYTNLGVVGYDVRITQNNG